MIAALLLQLAAPGAADLMARASSRLSAAPAAEADTASTQYRIAGEASVDDGKQRALETTGAQCQVVGARMCTRKPRTWVKAALPQ